MTLTLHSNSNHSPCLFLLLDDEIQFFLNLNSSSSWGALLQDHSKCKNPTLLVWGAEHYTRTELCNFSIRMYAADFRPLHCRLLFFLCPHSTASEAVICYLRSQKRDLQCQWFPQRPPGCWVVLIQSPPHLTPPVSANLLNFVLSVLSR